LVTPEHSSLRACGPILKTHRRHTEEPAHTTQKGRCAIVERSLFLYQAPCFPTTRRARSCYDHHTTQAASRIHNGSWRSPKCEHIRFRLTIRSRVQRHLSYLPYLVLRRPWEASVTCRRGSLKTKPDFGLRRSLSWCIQARAGTSLSCDHPARSFEGAKPSAFKFQVEYPPHLNDGLGPRREIVCKPLPQFNSRARSPNVDEWVSVEQQNRRAGVPGADTELRGGVCQDQIGHRH